MQTWNRTGLIVVTCLLFSWLAGGCGEKQAGKPPQAGPPEVGVMTVQPRLVTLTTELPGRTASQMIAEVRPQVNGIIKKRLFTEGSDVKAGQVLYEIDPATYQAAYGSARAAKAKAEATLHTLRLKADRYRELVKVKAVSEQENDDAQAAVKQAEADVAAMDAAVETARINLAYTKVTAPIAGRIGRSAVTEGALVTASQSGALATIQQLGAMYVDIVQSSAELLRLKRNLSSGALKGGAPGQARVDLVLEDGSAYPQPGVLKFSEVTVDQSTGSITMRAVVPNPGGTLLPGMFVRALIKEGVNERGILIPQRGVTRNQTGNPMVMVVGADEKVEPRLIKVDRTLGDQWLVSEGVKTGDRVILEGFQKARPGTQVKAVPFGSRPEPPPAGAPAGKK